MADWKSTAQFSEELKILVTGRNLRGVAETETEALCTISDPSGYRKIAAIVVPYYLESRKGKADYGGDPEKLIPTYWINAFKAHSGLNAAGYVDLISEKQWGMWRTWVDTYGNKCCPVQSCPAPDADAAKAKADAEAKAKADAEAEKKKKAADEAAKKGDTPKRDKAEEPGTGPEEPAAETLAAYQSEYSGAEPTATGTSVGAVIAIGLAIGVVGLIVWKLWRRK